MKKTVTREYVDDETGEVRTLSHEEDIKTNRRKGEKPPEPFVLLYPLATAELKLTGRQYSVLMMLAGCINIETGVSAYSNQDVAKTLGQPKQYVSLIIGQLHERGIITRLGRGKVAINPTYIWRGKTAGREAAVRTTKVGA